VAKPHSTGICRLEWQVAVAVQHFTASPAGAPALIGRAITPATPQPAACLCEIAESAMHGRNRAFVDLFFRSLHSDEKLELSLQHGLLRSPHGTGCET